MMDAYLKIAMEIKDNMAKVFKAHRSITSGCLLGVLEEKLCKIVDYSLTTDAIPTNAMHSDGEGRCDIWTNEDESAEIERPIVEDKEKENAAEWTFQDCPKCGLPFVARDRFGLFCATGNCDWKEQDEKTNMGLLSTPSKL